MAQPSTEHWLTPQRNTGSHPAQYACGTWGSFRDYAETLTEEIGLIPKDAPEELARYFNWDAWTRDLEHDYTVVRADAISVYVFRDL